MCLSPLASQEGLTTGDHGVSCQHLEGAGLPCSIHSKQTKTLKERERTRAIKKKVFYRPQLKRDLLNL